MAVEPTSIIDKLCAALAPVTRQAGMAMALLGQYKQQTFQSHSRYAASHAIQSFILGLPAPREVNPERKRREISPAKLVSVLLKGAGDHEREARFKFESVA